MRTMNEDKIERLAGFIRQYARENNGASPVLSRIMEYMDMSKSTAYRYILELQRRGVVTYSGKRTLDGVFQQKIRSASRSVPIVGEIVCGSPDEQEEYVSGYIAIPAEWADGECFLLSAYGSSMVDAGIDDGDLVLVRRCESAKSGEIVVALTENGSTLKRLFWNEGKPRLHAENKDYPPSERDIYPRTLTVQGVALKVIKSIH